MAGIICLLLIAGAWLITGRLILVGSRKADRTVFPGPLSAWWPIFLAGVALLPPEIIDLIAGVWPDHNNQALRVQFVPYAFAVTLPFFGLAIAAAVVQVARVFRLFRRN
jgi:hypothetical protein